MFLKFRRVRLLLGGLALLVVVVACGPRAPSPTATPTPAEQSPSADAVDAVYSAWASLPNSEMSPLFGDRTEDRANIARLASALDSAIPIEPSEHLQAGDRGSYVTINYRDGTKRTVRRVLWCEQWSGGRDFVGGGCTGEFKALNDTWWVEGKGMVKSPELRAWWEDSTAFMPPMGSVSIPKAVRAGEPFSILGSDWKSSVRAPAETVRLSLVSSDEREIELGETGFGGEGVGSDGFAWEGAVPERTPGGRYFLRVASGDFSELVRPVCLENATPGATPAPSLQRAQVCPRLPLTDWLVSHLELKQGLTPGEPVELLLRVRSRTSGPVTIFHGSRPYDFVILGDDGTEVWRWSRWGVFTLELRNTLLQPGETLTYSATWDHRDQDCEPEPRVWGRPCSGNPMRPGRYSVRATFEGALSSDYREYRETIQAAPEVLEVLPRESALLQPMEPSFESNAIGDR